MAVDPADGRVDKVVRLVGVSTESWKHAVATAVSEAAMTIRELSRARVVDLDVEVRGADAPVFRALLEITFRVDRTRTTREGVAVQVHRYLVVADKTLTSAALKEAVLARLARGPAEVHVVVPRPPYPTAGLTLIDPLGGYMVPDAAGVELAAEQTLAQVHERLDTFMETIRPTAVAVTGEIREAHPVAAVQRLLELSSFDEIILSTGGPMLSRWIRMDVPSRLRRITDVPVTHISSAGAT